MLTEEQLLKAKIALARKNNEDPEKIIALECHKKAKTGFSEYGLPYRVYFDYLSERYRKNKDTVPINPCYPMPGYLIDKVIHVTKKDFNGPDQSNGNTYDNLNEEKKFSVYMLKEQSRDWKIFDERWKNVFSMFMVGYDFMKFSEFDFIGEVGTLNPGELRLLRNYFTNAVMNTFTENKDNGKYMLQEPESRPEDRYLYSDEPFILILEKDEIRDAVAVEKKMRIPPDERRRKLYKDMYGIDIYEE